MDMCEGFLHFTETIEAQYLFPNFLSDFFPRQEFNKCNNLYYCPSTQVHNKTHQ